jgi:aryl-alcohol dehydrogenase-like predicted oxidoreductase
MRHCRDMNYRPLGSTGLKVSELGFGCSHLAAVGQRDDREIMATLVQAVESGINFFDTADSYGQGRAEELLGKALRGRRSGVILASKAGYRLSAAGGMMAKLKPLVRPLLGRAIRPALVERVREARIQQDFAPDYLRRAVEGSLRRLRTDYLDLFQLHDPPAPAAHLVPVLTGLVRDGKVRHYGVSCRTPADAADWMLVPGVAIVQIKLNLAAFEEALSVLGQAARKGIGIVARQPLASGKLARLEDYRSLAKPGRTMPQAALQFALRFPEVSVVIAGMSSRAHLQENLQAPAAPSLTEEELERIYDTGTTHAYRC